jgi:hypothetical protein
VPRSSRRAHDISKVKSLRYPERFLFFDSESYVRKPADSIDGTAIDVPHEPRLIVVEYWRSEGGESPTYVRSELPNDGAFREGAFRSPDALCRSFWETVDELSARTTHAKTHRTITIVAHNAGYDMLATGAYVHLPALGWKLERPYEKGPVYICRAKKGQQKLDIVSSTNFFAASLKELAKTYGTEKLEMEDFNTTNVQALETYCRRDVEIVRMAILGLVRFLSSESLGPWRSTISSVAFGVWRRSFMPHTVSVHTDPLALALEHTAYNGGRTEAFWVGENARTTTDVDVNNLYGWALKTFSFPRRLLGSHDSGTLTVGELATKVRAERAYLIAEVTVRVERPVVPLKAGKLLFPIGEFQTTLCSPELELCLQRGEILSVGRWAEYDAAPIFQAYVEHINRLRVKAREAGDEATYKLCKSLVNHVYGKTGQRSEDWIRLTDWSEGEWPFEVAHLLPPIAPRVGRYEIIDATSGSRRQIVAMPTGIYLSDGVRRDAYDSFPAIAAYVTSHARVHLWRFIEIANGELDAQLNYSRSTDVDTRHVFYCDTDSLFVDKWGLERLERAGALHDSEIGKLKKEWTADSVEISGAKWYAAFIPHEFHQAGRSKDERCVEGYQPKDGTLGWEGGLSTEGPHRFRLVRHKGVPFDAVLRTHPETGEPAFQVTQFPKLAGRVQAGEVGRFANRRLWKKGTVEYSKAIVPDDRVGWVRPFRLPEDAERSGLDLLRVALGSEAEGISNREIMGGLGRANMAGLKGENEPK